MQSFWCYFLTRFQIIVDSHAIVRVVHRDLIGPFIQFLPIIISYKIIEQYLKQYIDIDAVKIQNISITKMIPCVALL